MSYLTDQDVAERFRGARPGRELVAIEEAAIPVTVLRVLVSAQEEKPLPLLEEFVLRALYNGISEVGEIAAFLGLAADQLDDALVAQVQAGNITYRGDRELAGLTSQGKLAAIDLMSISAIEQEIPATFDRSIWRVAEYRENDLITKKVARDQGLIVIPALRTQHIEREDLRLVDLEHLVQAGKGRARRLQLLAILRSRVTKHRYLPVKLALFSDGISPEPEVLVIVDGEESFSHQRELEVLGGAAALGMSIEIPVTADSPSSSTSDRLDATLGSEELANFTQIGVYEHPLRLRAALTSAQRRILIISPWIRRAVVNSQFVADLEKRLKGGVDVQIGYGIGANDEGSDAAAVAKLRELAQRYANLRFVRLPNTHAKILIYDDVYITSSFNWLSFKGDPSRTYRMEEGTLIEGAAQADRVHKRYSQVLEESTVSAPGRPGKDEK
ncbi:phospholipase D-like domain-containing protein [Microbacterium sp. 179-I 1D1 NHS]|uniref:phospholipase D-like domain-containing protein n=1 Tax=Microbacterium sp. 179-I 1D1 NHS TaxID=3374298 RepID=UPI00387A2606